MSFLFRQFTLLIMISIYFHNEKGNTGKLLKSQTQSCYEVNTIIRWCYNSLINTGTENLSVTVISLLAFKEKSVNVALSW